MREYLIQNPGMFTAMVAGAVFVFVCLVGLAVLGSRSRRQVHDRITRMQAGPGKQRKLDLAKKAKQLHAPQVGDAVRHDRQEPAAPIRPRCATSSRAPARA